MMPTGDWMGSIYKQHGLPLSDSREAMARHPGRIYGPESDFPYTIVHDGDVIRRGAYTLRCVETVGHTQGTCACSFRGPTSCCAVTTSSVISLPHHHVDGDDESAGPDLDSLDMVAGHASRQGPDRPPVAHR
jgi:hypothetical protein